MPRFRVLFLWVAFLLPSGIVTGWLFLWLQWFFPLEDGVEPALMIVPTVLLVGLCLGGGWRAVRTNRASRQWLTPFAVSLLPLIFVVSAFGCADNFHKWCWPWTSLQPSLMAFLTDAEATATRLGVPRDRGLNPEEREVWSRIANRELTLRFPIINKPVTARVIDLTGRVWLHWGGDMFGYLDPVTMRIYGARN